MGMSGRSGTHDQADMNIHGSRIRLGLGPQLILGWLALSSHALAQELEPRAFSPNPTGLNYLVVSYSRSDGGVLFDPSIPITNVEAALNSAALGYGHTFGLFGRSATAQVVMPYVSGTITGQVEESSGETYGEVKRSGLADTSFQLSVNLLGGPALSASEFSRRTPETTLGVSLRVDAPTGQYYPDKFINIGTNRWGFRPQLGFSKPVGNFFLECYAGVWVYTANDDFFGGVRSSQAPLASLQLHGSYTFRPRLWLALDATGYRGGQTTVNGVERANLQENSRVGVTLSLPVSLRQSVKLAWSDGATTRAGATFRTLTIAWQYSWAD
jgi:Putative MetA-pathway of phenol degradation